jgi:hypothetical protein
MHTHEQAFTLTEAAQLTGRSRVTIRRYLDAGKFPNAWRGESAGAGAEPWFVPAGDLLAAGLDLGGGATRSDTGASRSGAARASSGALSVDPQDLPGGGQLEAAVALAHERERTIVLLEARVRELEGLLGQALATARSLADALAAPSAHIGVIGGDPAGARSVSGVGED